MAMTTAKAPDGDLSLGNTRGVILNCTTTAGDYVVGGYPLPAANVGLWKIVNVLINYMPGGFDLVWNTSTQRLQLLGTVVAATGATSIPETELTAGANTSGATFQITAVGY